jgi:hypothetical protein
MRIKKQQPAKRLMADGYWLKVKTAIKLPFVGWDWILGQRKIISLQWIFFFYPPCPDGYNER